MTKRELVNEVASRLNATQSDVATVVQELLDAVTDSLVEGNRLEIRNFGVFEVKERESRIGRNPRTGEEVPIPKKRVTSFRPGKALKEWVEAGIEHKPAHLFHAEDNEPERQDSGSPATDFSSSDLGAPALSSPDEAPTAPGDDPAKQPF